MAAVSPGTRLAAKQTSEIQFGSLGDEATSAALTTLQTLVRTCFGPSGKLKVLHNNSGGHVVVTSSSARLLAALSISKPVPRLLTTAVQCHINTFPDGGLFTSLFSLLLIQNSINLSLHRRLSMEINEFLLRRCLEYLSSSRCECKQSLEVGDLEQLNALVLSVIRPKVGCGLSPADTEHIASLIIKAFLRTFKGASDTSAKFTPGIVNRVSLEGRPASESQLLDGVLFAAPHIPTYRKRKVETPRLVGGSIRAALFTVSLAGDPEDVPEAVYELPVEETEDEVTLDLQEAVKQTLEDMVGQLVAAGVGVVCCQRVVHPTIRQLLKSHGVLVIDRLGSTHIGPVQALTGATLLASFLHPPPEEAYGVLDAVDHVVLGGRSYLHLVRRAAPVCTLVTCQRTESASEELKHVVSKCEEVLRHALHQPVVLAGGGCWQVHLAAYLRTIMGRHEMSWCRELSCSPGQLAQAGHAFCLALDQVAMATSDRDDHVTDSVHHHHWSLSRGRSGRDDWSKLDPRCSCGIHESAASSPRQFCYLGKDNNPCLNRDDVEFEIERNGGRPFEIMDLFDAYVNGLQTAVAAANMVLGIQHYIHDTN